MVNVSGRSKGCSTCRRRKIKCDETFPECFQCRKAGLCCPGARTGAFFVHALPERPLSRSSAKQRPLDSKCEPILSPSSHGTTSSTPSPSPLSLQQPGRADIFDQLFVSHFIESFGFRASVSDSPSPTWLDELSVFIVSPVPDLVKHSIRAGSMFFYGTLAQDVAIRTEACKWYMRALQGLQDVLSQNASPFTGDVICAAVMLTHFESLAGTSEGAWYQHVQGASMMLETGGPESCRDGFLHQLFRHLRLLTFVASFVKNEGHVFSTPEWISIPFELHPKGPFDYLVDILFSLLSCLTVADELIKAHGDKADALRERLKTLVLGLISQLHIWGKGCISMANIGELNPERWMEATSEDPESRCLDPHYFPILPHSDMPTAALFALYDSANIIALRLLFLVSSSAYLYEERIQRHAHSILSAKAFISAIPDPTSSRGSIMVGFQFKILSIWSPPGREEGPQHRKSASSSTTSTELFANIAAYVLRLHKPELLAEGLGHKIIA